MDETNGTGEGFPIVAPKENEMSLCAMPVLGSGAYEACEGTANKEI
jgi:hypothetical protein